MHWLAEDEPVESLEGVALVMMAQFLDAESQQPDGGIDGLEGSLNECIEPLVSVEPDGQVLPGCVRSDDPTPLGPESCQDEIHGLLPLRVAVPTDLKLGLRGQPCVCEDDLELSRSM